MTQTTLSAAVDVKTDTINVTSATGFAVNGLVYIGAGSNKECGRIKSINGTAIKISRGIEGTAVKAHAALDVVITGTAAEFAQAPPDLVGLGTWLDFGIMPIRKTYTALGAIAIERGLISLNGTTLAMTLADPTLADNGKVMCIMSENASAHTVTYTAGFNGGTTARDVATFGGAIGDNMVLVAKNGVWWVISTRNVTLG